MSRRERPDGRLGLGHGAVECGADVFEVVERHEVALAGELVQDRARDGVVEETRVVRRDVAVGVSLPDVYGYLDRAEIEAPVCREELEVLHRRSAGGARRPEGVAGEQFPYLGAGEDRDIRWGKLFDHEVQCAGGPATHRSHLEVEGELQDPRPASREGSEDLIRPHHAFDGARVGERTDTAHDRSRIDSSAEQRGAHR